MHRGQASAELVALCLAVVVGLCLLVRHAAQVEGVGRAVVEALTPDRPAPQQRPHRARGPRPYRPRPKREPRCYCPSDPRFGGAAVKGDPPPRDRTPALVPRDRR